MINPQDLVDLMVARLRSLPEIKDVFPDSGQIRAYHHDFPTSTSWFNVITGQDAGMTVRWTGSAANGNNRFVHQFEIALRVPEKTSNESIKIAVYQLWCGFVNSKVNGCRNWEVPLNNDVLPIMPPPSIAQVVDVNFQDYWLIKYSIQERGGYADA